MENIVLYGVTAALVVVSTIKNRKKTVVALKKAWKAFENILPQLLVVVLFVGAMLAVLNNEVILKIIGKDSGWYGVALSAAVGSVTLIPPFVAFPMASMLLAGGAGTMQIAAFVSTLMMVGVLTLPVEMKYFGRKLAVLRNVLALVFSIIVAIVINWVVG